MFIYPYRRGSKSVKALSEELNAKVIKLVGSKFKGKPNKLVLNWGCTDLPNEVKKCQVINNPDNVGLAANKLEFFTHIRDGELDVNIPEFSQDKGWAAKKIVSGHLVVIRTILTGHSGAGIVIADNLDTLNENPAPLYVEYIKKKYEYRVHVIGGVAVDVQRKARNRDVPDDEVNWKVQNLAGGFIYARNEGLAFEERMLDLAVRAVEACELDFGAVDIIYSKQRDKYYVLEVNTAPGLAGTTLEKYCLMLKKYEDRLA